MTRQRNSARCPQCGTATKGKFCTECGAVLERDAPGQPRAEPGVPRLAVAGAITVVAIAAFLIGRASSTGGTEPDGTSLGAQRIGSAATLPAEERASRLFDQVMRYGETGRIDSARYVAPMAIQAYESLGPLDAHARYDIGMIGAVTGDTAIARAQADTILRQRPTHLLGLALAMRTAKEPAARAAFARRLVAANAAELASPLPEYADHGNDVKNALAAAQRAP